MSLDRLISRELRRNPPDVEERVRATGAGLRDFSANERKEQSFQFLGMNVKFRSYVPDDEVWVYQGGANPQKIVIKNTGQTPHNDSQ